MFRKKTGVKIMAVILAAAIAMPSAGTALAAGREAVRQETEDSGGTWWDNLLHALYAESGSEEEGKRSTKTNTSTNTYTSTRPVNIYAVKLQVTAPDGIVYGEGGEALKDKITVTAAPLENSDTTQEDVKGFNKDNDCLLKFYDAQKAELQEAPKDAGTYFVRAYSLEESHYKSKGSDYIEFTIAQKPITIKPVDKKMKLADFADKQFPEEWEAELAEGSELAYEEELAADYKVACAVKKEGVEVKDPKAGIYDLEITGEPNLALNGGAKADNYEVAFSGGRLTIGTELALEVEKNKKIAYGEFEKEKFAVTATLDGKSVSLNDKGISFHYFDESGEKELLEADVRNAGVYKVVAEYEYDDANGTTYWGESAPEAFEITKRSITVKVESFEIKNGTELSEAEKELQNHLVIEGLVEKEGGKGLPYDDEWETEPTAKFKDENIDTTVAGPYDVLVEARLKADCKGNYALTLNNDGKMMVGVAEGEEKKELKLELNEVSVVYGDGDSKVPSENIKDAVIKEIKATEKDGGKEVDLPKERDKYDLKFYDSEKKPLDTVPVDVAEKGYLVTAAYKEDVTYKESEATDFAKLTITARTITIEAESYGIPNGAELPEARLKAYDNLSYEDKWAEGGEPKASYKEEIDTKKGGDYVIEVTAKVEEAKADNYNLDLKPGTLSVANLGDTGKSLYEFKLKEGVATDKVYDGKAFDSITKDSFENKFAYDKDFEFIWDGDPSKSAPKDAGKYTLTVKIPEADLVWEGSTNLTIEIKQRTLTAQAALKSGISNETPAGEPLSSSKFEVVTKEPFVDGDKWIKEPVVKIVEGDVNKKDSVYKVKAADGDAGPNYEVAYGDPVEIKVLGENKPLIGSVELKLPKKGYTYTGEQICPTATVKCGKTKLKLNVDYVMDYSDNVNAGTATAIVRGIGEYAGYQEKEFSIAPKNMNKVTLSEVGAVMMGADLEENLKATLVVMDGIYQVSPDDYDILISVDGKKNNFKSLEEVSCPDNEVIDKAKLKIKAKSGDNYNYQGESNKSVKLVILGSGVQNAKPITDVTFNESCLKIPTKGYTYNGKAQKPKVKISGVKEFKAVYSNNVNAGEAEVRIVGVYNKKKGTGYYGVSAPVTFEIQQKDISKVKVSAGTAIPKNGSRDDIKLTVKDGKRILTEGVDYDTVIGSDILDENNQIKTNIRAGAKCSVKIVALGGNYKEGSSKTATVKFGQLNLASRTAKIDVSTTGSDKSNVKVVYNGVVLEQNKDYTVSKMKEKNGSYTITIKAAKDKTCLYKGSKTVKNVTVTQAPAEQ